MKLNGCGASSVSVTSGGLSWNETERVRIYNIRLKIHSKNEPVTSPISVSSPSAGDSPSTVTTPPTKEDHDSSMEEIPVTNDVTPVTNENGNAPTPSSKTEELGDKEGPQILT